MLMGELLNAPHAQRGHTALVPLTDPMCAHWASTVKPEPQIAPHVKQASDALSLQVMYTFK